MVDHSGGTVAGTATILGESRSLFLEKCAAVCTCRACPGTLRLADHDFADLYDGRQVGVVRNVRHDLLGVRAESALESFDRIAVDVAHAHVGRRLAGSTASQSFV